MDEYENMTASLGLNGTTFATEKDELSFEAFAPTLSQCFFIVLTSYFIGKIQLLSASDLRGVTAFAAYFAMPGIICVKLADADLDNLEWQLLVGTFLGKAVIFGIVAGGTMLLTQPADVPMAGMLAMFCVQCNDLPVGNPLMSSLYGRKRPHLLKYLFLIPALTIAVFNPITHAMIEVFKDNAKPHHNGIPQDRPGAPINSEVPCKTRLTIFHKMAGEIILNLMKNPVIIATFFGIILNLSFKAHVPSVVYQPINVVATMIPGLALSVLGFSMLGREKHILSSGIILATVLIVVKMVVTPLVLYSCVKILVGNHHKEMVDFTLLYGIISPAAIVFQYGEKYRFSIAGMSAALILSSFTCFPLSYVIAKLSLYEDHDLNYYLPNLRYILLFVGTVSVLCCMSVWVSFLWNKHWRKPICFYVFCLSFAQIWMAIGIILWVVSDDRQQWTLQGQVILARGGEISICIWTAALSLLMVIQQGNQTVSRKSVIVIPFCIFGLTSAATAIMCLQVFRYELRDVLLFGQPRFNYEYFQLDMTTGIHVVSLVIVGMCFVLYRKRRESPTDARDPVAIPVEMNGAENAAFVVDLRCPESQEKRVSTISTTSTVRAFDEKDEKTLYYDEVVRTGQSEKTLVFGAEWTSRIISLLVLLWITMAIKFLANVLKIADCKVIAMTVPLEYLQAVLFTGQGLWTFLTCGIDIRTALISLMKRWRQMRRGKEELQKDPLAEESEDVKAACEQFRMFFYDRSFKELAKERVWKKNHYRNSFWGHQMVNWLIKAGLAKDELEAEEYGQKLLLGGIISHIRSAHDFLDAPYLYYFAKN